MIVCKKTVRYSIRIAQSAVYLKKNEIDAYCTLKNPDDVCSLYQHVGLMYWLNVLRRPNTCDIYHISNHLSFISRRYIYIPLWPEPSMHTFFRVCIEKSTYRTVRFHTKSINLQTLTDEQPIRFCSILTLPSYSTWNLVFVDVIFAKESNRNKLCVHSKNGSTLDGFTRRL